MEDRSTLLKVYNDRTTLLNKGTLSLKQLIEYLDQRALHISKHLLSAMANHSSVTNFIRPELLIEGILQYLKGKRNFSQESNLLNSMFQEKDSWSFDDFRETFTSTFLSLYDANEISRILQLVKRFGLAPDNTVPYEYLYKLVYTCQLKNFDIMKNSKKLVFSLQKAVFKLGFGKIAEIRHGFWRRPLEIISNESFSVSRDGGRKKGELNSKNLRNKLFWQACRNFAGWYLGRIKGECFAMVRDPYRFRDPYVHRAVFKVYLRMRNKACEVLSKALMKWNNLPEFFVDCINAMNIKDCTGTMGFTRENTVGLSKQYSMLTLTNEFKGRNSKVIGMLLEKTFRTAVIRVQRIGFCALFPDFKEKVKKMEKNLKNALVFVLQKGFFMFVVNAKVKMQLDSIEKKQNYQNKRQKYTLTNKGKKIAARSIAKMVSFKVLKLSFVKFRGNTRFPQRKILRNFAKTVQIDLPKKPQGLSRSFVVNSTSVSPKVSNKYEEMKNSVKKIKIHHGFEKLWIVTRKIQKRIKEFPKLQPFYFWRNFKPTQPLTINLQKVSSTRFHHSSQFSFRDKV